MTAPEPPPNVPAPYWSNGITATPWPAPTPVAPDDLLLAAERLVALAGEIAEAEGYYVAQKLEGAAVLLRRTAAGALADAPMSPAGAATSHRMARAILGYAPGARL